MDILTQKDEFKQSTNDYDWLEMVFIFGKTIMNGTNMLKKIVQEKILK
jgi:hypothetical protein